MGNRYEAYVESPWTDDDGAIRLVLEESASRNAVIVQAHFQLMKDSDPVIVSVDATRCPEDKWDDEVGYNLAWGRAFEQLGIKLKKRAQGKMDHNDEMRRIAEDPKLALEREKKKNKWENKLVKLEIESKDSKKEKKKKK
jgi:hypothetical protein